jgi:FkbM family methyltransferase
MFSKLGRNAKLAARNLVSRAKRRIVGPNVEAFLTTSRNGLFLVDVQDQVVGGTLSSRGEYGREELDRLAAALQGNARALVVGTHVGTLAIPASKLCSHMTAIEANPKTFRLLQMNLLLNSCSNVRAINIAAGDKAETIEFLMNRVNSGGSKRLPVRSDYAYVYDSPEVARIEAQPLDEVLAGEEFDVILMDIEGSEYFALKGMQRILASAKVLFMEFVPHHLRNVSGVSVEDMMSTIAPHFRTVFIPSKNVRVERGEFVPVFQSMYDREESDEGLEFSK